MSFTPIASLTAVLARDAMHEPIVACGPATPLEEVARLLAAHRVHAVVVEGIAEDDHGAHLVWGVITDEDLLDAAISADADPVAGQVARTQALIVEAGDDLTTVATMLAERDCTHAVVVQDDGPVGIVSTLDIASVLAAP